MSELSSVVVLGSALTLVAHHPVGISKGKGKGAPDFNGSKRARLAEFPPEDLLCELRRDGLRLGGIRVRHTPTDTRILLHVCSDSTGLVEEVALTMPRLTYPNLVCHRELWAPNTFHIGRDAR